MILDSKKEADRVGLNMNTNKLNQTGHGALPICINGQNIEGIISLSRNPRYALVYTNHTALDCDP